MSIWCHSFCGLIFFNNIIKEPTFSFEQCVGIPAGFKEFKNTIVIIRVIHCLILIHNTVNCFMYHGWLHPDFTYLQRTNDFQQICISSAVVDRGMTDRQSNNDKAVDYHVLFE